MSWLDRHRKTMQCLQRGRPFGVLGKSRGAWGKGWRKMAHPSSKYDSIRELDARGKGQKPIMLPLDKYMEPPPFWELGGSINEEEVGYEPPRPPRLANSSNRIRVKNIRTGVLIEFDKMVNAARFVGTTGNHMRWGLDYEKARVFREGEEDYVFEYDGVERPIESYIIQKEKGGSVMAVSANGERISFPSYIAVANYLGLLAGHIYEEAKRQLAKKYIIGKETFTLEFGGKKRQKDHGRGIHCRWGVYMMGILKGLVE